VKRREFIGPTRDAWPIAVHAQLTVDLDNRAPLEGAGLCLAA
jgi:hypothetical protein